MDITGLTSLLLCMIAFTEAQPSTAGTNSTAPGHLCILNGLCYHVYRYDEPVTRPHAHRICQDNGMVLATVPTSDAGARLARLPALGSEHAWIGLFFNEVNDWKWLHSNGWYENIIPESLITRVNETNPCLFVNRVGLKFASCSRPLKVICESSADLASAVECGLGKYRIEDNRWICISQANYTWMDAARHCSRVASSLLILNTNETLQKVRDVLQKIVFDSSPHFWTAGTRVVPHWEDESVNINPYNLLWEEPSATNPNLDAALRNGGLCITLSRSGLKWRPCGSLIPVVICSKANPNIITWTSTDQPSTSSQVDAVHVSSPGAFLEPEVVTADSTASSISNNKTKDRPANCTDFIPAVPASASEDHLLESSAERYKVAIICAYIFATLFGIGLILLIIVLVRKRRQRRLKVYDPKTKSSSTSLGHGTLGRNRNTVPAEEWGKVMSENKEHMPMLINNTADSIDVEIIHNVPLDTRSEASKPLTIPKESEYVTLRNKKTRSSAGSSVSSDVATFTSQTSSTSSTPRPVPPPLPPKLKLLEEFDLQQAAEPSHWDEGDFPLPPPPEELLFVDERARIPPLLPPKPPKRAPVRKNRKKHADSVYAKIDKSQRSLKRNQSEPDPDAQSSKQDSTDSGIEMGMTSPTRSANKKDLAYLDQALAQLQG